MNFFFDGHLFVRRVKFILYLVDKGKYKVCGVRQEIGIESKKTNNSSRLQNHNNSVLNCTHNFAAFQSTCTLIFRTSKVHFSTPYFRTSEVPIPSSPGVKIQIARRPPSPDDFEVGSCSWKSVVIVDTFIMFLIRLRVCVIVKTMWNWLAHVTTIVAPQLPRSQQRIGQDFKSRSGVELEFCFPNSVSADAVFKGHILISAPSPLQWNTALQLTWAEPPLRLLIAPPSLATAAHICGFEEHLFKYHNRSTGCLSGGHLKLFLFWADWIQTAIKSYVGVDSTLLSG